MKIEYTQLLRYTYHWGEYMFHYFDYSLSQSDILKKGNPPDIKCSFQNQLQAMAQENLRESLSNQQLMTV